MNQIIAAQLACEPKHDRFVAECGARRHFTLLPYRTVIIRDEWKISDKSTEVSCQWLTQATATTEPDGFVLRQAGGTLHLRATASSPLTRIRDDARSGLTRENESRQGQQDQPPGRAVAGP